VLREEMMGMTNGPTALEQLMRKSLAGEEG